MKKQIMSMALIISIIIGQIPFSLSFADRQLVGFNDIKETHWIYPMLVALQKSTFIQTENTFGLGSKITEDDLANYLKKLFPEKTFDSLYDKTKYLTRKMTLTHIFTLLELTHLVNQNDTYPSPFIDTTTDSALYKVALDLNWISMNSSKRFRPNDDIKKEELIAILYNIYLSKTSILDQLQSYYAISSYNQINLINTLDTLYIGWSRLEFNKDKTSVVLNMTSSNSNEYKVPNGYSEVINESNNSKTSIPLMIFVKNDSLNSTNLSNLIISDESYKRATLDAIKKVIETNAYNIKFSGILIDIEGLKGQEQAQKLNQFIKELDSFLEERSLSLSVAVHPQIKNSLDYFDGYDYRTLSQYADYLVLMAHDYYPKSLSESDLKTKQTVTPLSPISEIYYALTKITDLEKGVLDKKQVVLQLSMDSVQWKMKDGLIVNKTPYHPTYDAIEKRMKEGAEVFYSKNLESPYMTYFDSVDNTENIIWYENQLSIQAKIDLAKYFKIGGISVWRLGIIPSSEVGELNIWSQIQKNY